MKENEPTEKEAEIAKSYEWLDKRKTGQWWANRVGQTTIAEKMADFHLEQSADLRAENDRLTRQLAEAIEVRTLRRSDELD